MRTVVFVTAALAAAVVVSVAATLPPRQIALQPSPDGTIAGMLHVHTTRSDGRGTPDEIAAAAARAGLRFVVFTDHGDGTRPSDPPAYRSGVLCLDGVEISTTGGHYIALDMAPAPYPVAGEPRDVVEDVRRLGGFGIVAHPDSPKAALRWRDWAVAFDAFEWLNPDTSWREISLAPAWSERFRLVEALLHYPFRAPESMAQVLGEPGELARWEALAARRRVVALAGSDAHAKLALKNTDPGDNRYTLPLPGYEATFRMMSVRVALPRPLSRDAARDGAMLVRALRAGHAYTAVDAFATPPSLTFSAHNDLGTVHEGDELGASGPVTLDVRTNAPAGFTTTVYKGFGVLAESAGPVLSVQAPPDPAVYRVEVTRPEGNRRQRWIVSNAIYVRAPEVTAAPPAHVPPKVTEPMFNTAWRVEHGGGATGQIEAPGPQGGSDLALRFALDPGPPAGQYVALVFDTPRGVAPDDRLTFTMRADRPMRVSVQVRVPGGTAGRRWQRSVYVPVFDQERTVFFSDLTPVADAGSWKPPLSDVRSVMLVIDTTNTKPGTSGTLSIKSAARQH